MSVNPNIAVSLRGISGKSVSEREARVRRNANTNDFGNIARKEVCDPVDRPARRFIIFTPTFITTVFAHTVGIVPPSMT